jgi:hypothetical protein
VRYLAGCWVLLLDSAWISRNLGDITCWRMAQPPFFGSLFGKDNRWNTLL